ncbi:ClpXP protease specificity-enhancing factor [Isoalcanivorax indicus]|uniref:ClpXP protease specificity-enhancing factor n=1 Tax=Isoalcanivorax indicus TaxID=2202653 RepID=UPI000DBAC50A|nr:ClpXP protease specificity-enhancing factor [Isoalcanivorax indicus]
MTPNRPYLIRAVHEWICDNGLTTHLLVDAGYPGVQVPREHVNEGQIILNVAPGAVQGFMAGNDEVVFSARFSGRAMNIVVPVNAVLAVFARENGEGMAFEPVAPPEPPEPSDDSPDDNGGRRPALKVVK